MIFNGERSNRSFDEIVARYRDQWTGPTSFQWRDLAYDVLNPDSVIVTGAFDWGTPDGVEKYAYSGVLQRQEGEFRIRLEVESSIPIGAGRAAMILRKLASAIRRQDWFTVLLEVRDRGAGCFHRYPGGELERCSGSAKRRDLIVAALITDLRDAAAAQEGFTREIVQGLAGWESAFAAGKRPAPYDHANRRIGHGAKDMGDISSQQMPLTDMLDPVTIFDLGFYYSELDGVGVKYIRYVSFVESDVLPYLERNPDAFYEPGGSALLPEYAANMDRLDEYARESDRLRAMG